MSEILVLVFVIGFGVSFANGAMTFRRASQHSLEAELFTMDAL